MWGQGSILIRSQMVQTSAIYLVLWVHYLLQVVSYRMTSRKPPLPICISKPYTCMYTQMWTYMSTLLLWYCVSFLPATNLEAEMAFSHPLEYCNVLSKQSLISSTFYQPQRFPLTFALVSVPRIHCITHYGNGEYGDCASSSEAKINPLELRKEGVRFSFCCLFFTPS